MKKIITVVIIIVVAGIGFGIWSAAQPGELDGFAQCLKDKGTIFYGAFWCPHCQNQKKLFGRSASLLPYVECSTANGQGMLPICQDNQVTGYPTWVFPDGSRESGEVPLATLAEKSSCPLPVDTTSHPAVPTTTLPNTMTIPTTTSPQP